MPGRDLSADTASLGGASPPSRPTPSPVRLGRYAIERELARGGMGVVFVAFDPELERRIALKKLTASDEGNRERLLHEARAMARLAHPNVVTVHDVVTIDGQDYVAMELMEGGTLADWLTTKRRTRDIVAAFIAAGNGLAAAHAAGLVHRDFKPSNVLRARDGRFAVTDFGIAHALDDTRPSGSNIGTPQYMAPEQWRDAPLSPATDQFAFCVSLWEALAGTRPFHGTSDDTLRDAVARGTADLDATQLPRRLRAVVARGLDPDPEHRWPDIASLLSALQRAEKRPRQIAMGVAALAVISGVLVVARVMQPGADDCGGLSPRPAFDSVWDPFHNATLGGNHKNYSVLRTALDADANTWVELRGEACRDPIANVAELQCLGGIAARASAIVEVASKSPRGALRLEDFTADPAICAHQPVPHLMPEWNAEARAALQLLADEPNPKTPMPPVAAGDLCGTALARLVDATRSDGSHALYEIAIDAATQCGDDQLRATVLLHALNADMFAARDVKLEAAAREAVSRVPQVELEAFLVQAEAVHLSHELRYDEAIVSLHATEQRLREKHRERLATELALDELVARLRRGTAEDLVEAPRIHAALAAEVHEPQIDSLGAWIAWEHGDVAGAHAEFERIPADEEGWPGAAATSGVVVDAGGVPVAGAEVFAGPGVALDAVSWLPFVDFPIRVTTDAHGAFTLPGSQGTVVVAQKGHLRASGERADGRSLRLVLQPTRRITGTLDGWANPRRPLVAATVPGVPEVQYVVRPAPDGSFVLDGVPDTRLQIQVAAGFADDGSPAITVDGGNVDHVALHVPPADRTVRVEVTPATAAPPLAVIVAFWSDGPLPETSMESRTHDLYAVRVGVQAPKGAFVAEAKRLPHVPLIACAIGDFGVQRPDATLASWSWFYRGDSRIACERVDVDRDNLTLHLAPTELK